MPTDMEDLKQYIRDTLGAQINQISSSLDNQAATLRQIEITQSTSIVEVRKDIADMKEDIKRIETTQAKQEQSQKFRWKDHDTKAEADKQEQNKKDIENAKINDRMNTIIKLLWSFLALASTLVIGFLWQLLINGGIRNIIP